MVKPKSEVAVLHGVVIFALAMAIIGTILSIPGPFEFGGPSEGLVTRYGERIRVVLLERCDLGPTADTPEGNVGFSGVCEAELEVGGPIDWTAPLHQPGFAIARVGTGLLAVAILYLLLRIVRTLRAGDPFVSANARRLTAIGVLVAGGGMAVQYVRTIAEMNALDRVQRLAPELATQQTFELSFLPLLAGLLVVGLAEVFRQGARLRADVEGLV